MKKALTLLSLGVFCASVALAADTTNEPVKGMRQGSAASQAAPLPNSQTLPLSHQTIIFEDNMDQLNDTAGLHARGYVTVYNSEGPQGDAAFFNGNPTNFHAYNGHDSSYVASNFQTVQGQADIDNWLILPANNIQIGDSLVFFARSPVPVTDEYPDSIRVMYSQTGDLDVQDTDWIELGRFKVRNDGLWGRMGYRAPTAGTGARFAIRYTVANGGPAGVNSNYIGIDHISIFSSPPLALDENAAALRMRTYPNPAHHLLMVQSVASSGTLTVTNALGQQVQRQPVAGTTNAVNISGLASGVYAITIQSEKGVATLKFVKQ